MLCYNVTLIAVYYAKSLVPFLTYTLDWKNVVMWKLYTINNETQQIYG